MGTVHFAACKARCSACVSDGEPSIGGNRCVHPIVRAPTETNPHRQRKENRCAAPSRNLPDKCARPSAETMRLKKSGRAIVASSWSSPGNISLCRSVSAKTKKNILQNAYCSFCRRLEIGEFELNSRAEIWNLLAKITIGKARKAAEKHRREKRDVRRERSAIGNGMDSLSSGGLLRQLMSDEPSPDCVAEFADSLKRIIQCLPSPSTRLLLLYKLEGYTNAEVADRLGCTPRTVERKLATIRAAAQGIL